MDVIILLGAPGSGKGTTAERVKNKTRYKHISTGDILRNSVKIGTSVGQEAEAYMRKGELVPDSVMIKLVEECFNNGSDNDSYMLDGFPRTIAQADLLEKSLEARAVEKGDGSKISAVFFLDAPGDVLIKRLTGRRICKACGEVYHIINMPPREEGVCDSCGGELYQRSDDCEETIANRLDVYNRETKSLIGKYQEQGLLISINSDQVADKLAEDVIISLKNRLNQDI